MKHLLLLAVAASLHAQVVSAHNGSAQNGSVNETQLTTGNVKAATFRKQCSATVSGDTYAQVLFVPGLVVSGVAHDTAIVTTMENNVYAFDGSTCAQLWTANLGTPWTNYSVCCTGNEIFYGNPMGILGTGVINLSTLKLYVVSATATGGTTNPIQVLNRINLATGSVEASVTVSGSVSGTGGTGDSGNCLSGTTLSFRTVDNMQVSGLSLSPDGSKVYLGFGGWENGTPCYHGWVFAYSTTGSMSQLGIFCTTPDGNGGSPWMSRGAPAVDAAGRVYVSTGNGDWNGTTNFSMSVLEFSSTLSVIASFVDPNWSPDDSVDADLSSGRFMLVLGSTYGIIAGKDFNVYVLDTSAGMAQAQTFKTSSATVTDSTGSFGSLFMNGVLYLPISTGPLYAFTCPSGVCTTTPAYVTGSTYAGHNGQISGSINGSSDGIVWITTSATFPISHNTPGTLRAINASTGAELWNSDTTAGDTLGNISKFAAPTVANGKVFAVNNSGTMQVYSLIPGSQLRGAGTLRGAATLR